MRRAAAALSAFFGMLFFCVPSFAQQHGENLLASFQTAEWEGAPLGYDADHAALFFLGEPAETAQIDFPVGDARGFLFYADLGNFENAGIGYLTLELLDGSGAVLERYETEKTAGDGSFHRYRLGSESAYARLPENTESVRIGLVFENGKTPYFRNPALYLDNMKTIETSMPEWSVSGKLQLVQIGVTKTQYWSWVLMIAAVPVLMFVTRKWMDRAKKLP